MKWRSKRCFCFVRIDERYQPWNKRRSLPPCGLCLATSNISPNNKVNAQKKNLLPVTAGNYGKSTKYSSWQRHQANTGKSGLETEWFRGLGALHSWESKKKVSAETRCKTYFESNEEKVKWIEDYVVQETAVARKWVQDAEAVIMQEQDHLDNAGKGGSTTTQSEITFEELLNAIRDSLSDVASSEYEYDGDDEDDDEEDTGLDKLSEDAKPDWVMGTISKMVRNQMETFQQKQMRLHEVTQSGWGDAADYSGERDMQYRLTELIIPALSTSQTDTTAATPSPTTFGELMNAHDIIPGQSQMPQVMSWQRSHQMRLCSEKPQAVNHVGHPMSNVVRNTSQMEIAILVQPVSIYLCI
jgi:hypothetical protein